MRMILRWPEPIYMRVGREHVKANPEILTILSCVRVSIAVENWMASRFSRRSGFISPQNENLSSQKLPRGFRRCYILFCSYFCRTWTNKCRVSWIHRRCLISTVTSMQQKVDCIKALTVFTVLMTYEINRCSCLIAHFLPKMPWVRKTFQIRDSLSALFRYLCVYVYKCLRAKLGWKNSHVCHTRNHAWRITASRPVDFHVLSRPRYFLLLLRRIYRPHQIYYPKEIT